MARKTPKMVGATLWVQRGSVRPATGPPDQKVKSADSTKRTYSAGRSTWMNANPERTRSRRGSAALSPTPRRLPRGGPRVQDHRDAVQPFVRLLVVAVGERGGHVLEQLLDLPALGVGELGRPARSLQAGDLFPTEPPGHPTVVPRPGPVVDPTHSADQCLPSPRYD